jgi:uncharacterized protein YgiM (DUF1202 family)
VAARYDLPAVPQTVSLPEPAAPVAPTETTAVFSLAPFVDQTKEALPPAEGAGADAQPPILYVSASSVNVRQGPSTAEAVIGRLARGEAVTVVEDAGDGWSHIRIEGDGIDGFIATRLLSDAAPAN